MGTNLWKFGLNWSSKLQEIKKRKEKNALFPHLVCFQMYYKRLQLKYLIILCDKFSLSKKNCYFRGSRFSQCFILSTALPYSLPTKFLCSPLFWVKPIVSSTFKLAFQESLALQSDQNEIIYTTQNYDEVSKRLMKWKGMKWQTSACFHRFNQQYINDDDLFVLKISGWW